MEKLYPCSPTISDPLYILCTRPYLRCATPVLYKFLLEYPQLEIAGSLLPKLVKLYQWLHRELAHRLTVETAKKLSVAKLCKKIHSQFPSEKAKDFESLYTEVAGTHLHEEVVLQVSALCS